MSTPVKQTLREEYKRLKKALQKIMKPKGKETGTQWVLQPVPIRNPRF